MEAHARDADLVDREGPVRNAETGHRIRDAVAPEHRNPALTKPRQAVRVESRHAVRGIHEAALRGAPRTAPGSDEQDVPLTDLHALTRLGRFERVDADRRVRGEMVYTLGRRDVEQHAPADYPLGEGEDGVLSCAATADVRGRVAVVHLSAPEHVTERVDVGHAEAVHVCADIVATRLVTGNPVVVAGVPGREHVMLRGIGIFRGRNYAEIVREADSESVLHGRGRRRAVFVAQVVQHAPFVVVAPTPPVRERVEALVELGLARNSDPAVLTHSLSFSSP